MKALRILITILVILAALVALLVVLALTPSIQTWAVRKAVAGQPGMKLDVKRISAGLSTADITDVHLVKDGMVVTASNVHAKYSALDYLFHHRVSVDTLTATDLVIDTRNTVPPATGNAQASPSTHPPSSPSGAAPGQRFNGLLNQIQLPFDVQIARFSIPGRALLSNEQTATFEIHGSDITTGRRGTIDWKADLSSTAANAAARAVHTTGTATLHITTERRIDLLEINSVAAVEGPKLPSDQIKLEAKAEQPAAGGNEGYNATVSIVRHETAEPLATLAGQYNAGAHEVSGVWNVAIRPAQLSELLTGLGLPDISADGAGKFAANPDAGTANATGDLRAAISHPEKLSPDLAAIGQMNVRITFNGGLADKIARLEQLAVDAADANGHKLVQIRTLQRAGFSLVDKHVVLDEPKAEIARVTVDAFPLAWAQPFAKPLTIDSGQASMVLAIAAEPDGSHVRVTTVQPFTLRNVTVRNGAQKLADQLTLSVKPQADYSSDHLRAELNDLSMTTPSGDSVTGRFTADIADLSKTRQIAFTTDTQAKFVSMLKPYLNVETGPMLVSTKSEGTLAGETLHFAVSTTKVTRDNGQLVGAVELVQPLTFDLQTKAITGAKPDTEALRLTVGQVPLAWLQGVVANSKFDGQVSGGAIGIKLKSMEDLTADATQPITLKGVSVALNGQPMLQNVDAEADFSVTKHGDTIAFNVRKVEAKQGAATLLTIATTGEAKLTEKPTIAAKGTLNGDLGALARQPAAAASDSLASGKLDGTFDVNLSASVQATAKITARDLVAKQGNRALGTAVLDASATVQSDGSSVLKVPFTLTNGQRKSDVMIDGKVGRAGNTLTFDGKITSEHLFIDDLQPLAALAPASKSGGTSTAGNAGGATAVPARKAGGTAALPDVSGSPAAPISPAPAQAFWAGVQGRLSLDLKEITYGANYIISAVQGAAVITPTEVALNSLQGKFKDEPFKMDARVDFAANQPQPYTLTASANVTNFDVGAFLQAANPGEKPQLETNVSVDAKLNGKGTSAGDLAKNIYGTFDVNGTKGVLRALGQKAGSAVNLASGVAGLIGQAKGSDTTVALADLARKFAELPFDRLTMHVDRGADLNLKVTQLEFVSPDTRITGSGLIKNEPGVPIEKQPMELTLTLGAKADMAVLLNRVHALGDKQDDQGYQIMAHTFTIGGSASKSDSSNLWTILGQVGIQTVLPSLLERLGR